MAGPGTTRQVAAQSDEVRLLALLDQALELPEAERAAWLAGDAVPDALRARLAALLAGDAALGGFLEGGAAALPTGFPRPGERLGAYRLLAEIDSGGMGVVYRAHRDDAAFEQDVAIKLVRPVHLLAPEPVRSQLVQRFEAERRLLARLSHPNIARILDGGSTPEGIPWLVMEYVEGENLLAWCRSHAPRLAQRIALFARVCDAVQEAHRHLIVHRDLKPANVLVDRDGEPRLLDFGIARALAAEGDGTATMTAQDAMTPAYASPEQVRRQPVTTSADVYSLGVMLYELLTEVRPYELAGLSPAAAERMVCEAPIEPLRTALARSGLPDDVQRRRRGELRGDLQRIVARAMHRDPALRYPTASALAEDLRSYLAGRPVQAHPDGLGYRLRMFLRRNRAASAVAALGLVAVLAASVVAMWQAVEARRNAADLQRVNDFLTSVLKLTDPYAQGMDVPLSQALDESAELVDARFGDRPDLASRIRLALGYSMLGRNRLDAAETQLTRALEESHAAFGPMHERTLRALEGVAGLRLEQGRKAEAQALFEDLLARVEAGPLADSSFHRLVLNNLGMLHLTIEDYEAAAGYLERALQVRGDDAPMPPEEHAVLLANAAQAAHGRGNLDRAQELYAQARLLLEGRFPDGHPDLAILLNNQALLEEDRGFPEQALALHLQSVEMRRRAFGDRHPMVAAALVNGARQALLLGRAELALAFTTEAVEIADAVYANPADRHVQALALHAQALLAVHAGTASGERDAASVAPPDAVRKAEDFLARARQLIAAVEAPVEGSTAAIAQAEAALATVQPPPTVQPPTTLQPPTTPLP